MVWFKDVLCRIWFEVCFDTTETLKMCYAKSYPAYIKI